MKYLLPILLFVSIGEAQTIRFFTGWERYLPNEAYFAVANSGGTNTNIYGINYTQYGDYSAFSLTPESGSGCYIATSFPDPFYPSYHQCEDIDFKYFVTPTYLWGTIYANFRVYFESNNSQSARIFHFANDFPFSHEFALQWTSTDKFALLINGVTQATSTNTLPLHTWLLCQMSTTWGNSGVTSTIKLNGETLTSNANIGTDSITGCMWGWIDQVGGNTIQGIIAFDNLVISTGAPADTNARALLSKPISDVSRSNWTNGDTGTTNLYKAVSNPLPIGATGTGLDSRIKNNNTSANNSYVVNLQDYITAGLPGGKQVYATQAMVRSGRGDTTGIDTGKISISSNPADASTNNFLFGTYPFNPTKKIFTPEFYGYLCGNSTNPACVDLYWFTTMGNITLNPTVNTSAQPQITVTRVNNASTNHNDAVDDIRINFLYIPASASTEPNNYWEW